MELGFLTAEISDKGDQPELRSKRKCTQIPWKTIDHRLFEVEEHVVSANQFLTTHGSQSICG